MTKLLFKDKPIVGLDISQTGIKIMAVDPKRWLVTGYGSIDLDPAKVQKSFDTDDGYLSESIKQIVSEKLIGTLPSNHVVVGVPAARSFIRTFTIPADAENTLNDAVTLEADRYIPIPTGSLYIDYAVIERTKEQLTVIMSAVPQVIVDTCMNACFAANLRPVMVEPSINAIARVLESTEDGRLPTLIVDIGPASTDIAVLERGVIRVSGGLGIGGNTFTLDIAKKLNIALENAHQLKVLNGLAAGQRQAKIAAALGPSLQRILGEINKVIRYYNERVNDERRLEQVLIVGSGSNVPGLGDYFTNELVMPVRAASPWQKLDFGKLPQPNKQFRPRYITVAGLASVNQEGIWK